MNKRKILIADDDPKICSLISDILKDNNFKSIQAHSTEEAWERIVDTVPDLIVLDVEIPMKGGLEFCRELKEKEDYQLIPIIFLTVRDKELDKVSALNLGGDDFITKPFRAKEFIARINVVLRRYTSLSPFGYTVKSDKLTIDFDKRMVQISKKDIHLTPKEFDLLELLCMNRSRVLSDRAIFDRVWGSQCGSLLSTVYTHIERLRKKLGKEGDKIRTIPGIGYRFDERSI